MTSAIGAATGAASASALVGDVVVADGIVVDGHPPASFVLHRGEVATIISAPPGDGHRLMRVASGLRAPESGGVTIAGVDLTSLDPAEAARRRFATVGYVLRDIGLRADWTVAQNLASPLSLAGRTNNRDDAEWLARIAQSFGLADGLDLPAGSLDAGRQQRVAIARALATRPALVFAEEPTARLDERAGSVVLALLRTIAHEFGIAIAIATDRTEVAAPSDRILVVRDGRIVLDGRGFTCNRIRAALDGAGDDALNDAGSPGE